MPERVARYMAGWSNISLNGRALALSLGLAVMAGIISGFTPALQALRIDLGDAAQIGARGRWWARGAAARPEEQILAASQISLAVALVVGAALMCKGMFGMLHLVDRYQPAKTLTFNVHLPEKRYDTPARKSGLK